MKKDETDNIDLFAQIPPSVDSSTSKVVKKNSLKHYHNSLLKLVDLFENECINEEQLKDIVKNIKNHTEEISWNSQHELILKEIGEISGIYYFIHLDSSDLFRKNHYQFTLPMFILTLLSSIFIFFSTNGDECDKASFRVNLAITAGIINLLVATLQKTMEYLQPEFWSIQHANSSKSFRYINDDIRTQLALNEAERDLMPAYLNKIITEYYIQKKNAPKIPPAIINKYKKKFNNIKSQRPDDFKNLTIPEEICFIRPMRISVKKPGNKKKLINESFDSDDHYDFDTINNNNNTNTINEITNVINQNEAATSTDELETTPLADNV